MDDVVSDGDLGYTEETDTDKYIRKKKKRDIRGRTKRKIAFHLNVIEYRNRQMMTIFISGNIPNYIVFFFFHNIGIGDHFC